MKKFAVLLALLIPALALLLPIPAAAIPEYCRDVCPTSPPCTTCLTTSGALWCCRPLQCGCFSAQPLDAAAEADLALLIAAEEVTSCQADQPAAEPASAPAVTEPAVP